MGFNSRELDLSTYRVKNHKVALPEAKSRMGCDLSTLLTIVMCRDIPDKRTPEVSFGSQHTVSTV